MMRPHNNIILKSKWPVKLRAVRKSVELCGIGSHRHEYNETACLSRDAATE